MTKSLFYAGLMVLFIACKEEAGKTEPAATETHTHAVMEEKSAMPTMEAIPEGARVYFKNLKNGEKVTSPFKVEMGVDNMQVDTANGNIKPASGHHHILIGLDSVAAGTVIPKDDMHRHFGNAQTSAELTLPSGSYKLTLQFADALHRSYGGKLTQTVEVTVK